MALGTGIEIPNNFDLNSPLPLDSRTIAATIAERDAIPLVARYVGMFCKVLDNGEGEQKLFWLVGGVGNEHWQEFSSGTGGGFKNVANKEDLDLIPLADRFDGLFVFQLDERILWVWNPSGIGKWEQHSNRYISNVSVLTTLSNEIRSIDNYIFVNPSADLTSPTSPFGAGIYNQVGVKVTVVNMSDFGICLRGGGSTWRIEGDDVWLSAKGHSATFLKASDSWILIGRSN